MSKIENVETLKAQAENVTVVVRTKKAPVKVSDLYLKMIAESAEIPEELKTKLLADLAALTAKVTTSGRLNLTEDVHAAIKAAGKDGISRNAIYNVLAAKYPDMVKEGPFAITDKMFSIYQPKNLEKVGVTIEGNNWNSIYF